MVDPFEYQTSPLLRSPLYFVSEFFLMHSPSIWNCNFNCLKSAEEKNHFNIFFLLQQVQIERRPDANAPREFGLTPGKESFKKFSLKKFL